MSRWKGEHYAIVFGLLLDLEFISGLAFGHTVPHQTEGFFVFMIIIATSIVGVATGRLSK